MASSDIENVKSRITLVDLLEHFGIDYNKKGAHYELCCPLPSHDEKTPSFKIKVNEPDSGHCYGCGGNVDIFKLYQELNGVEFYPALVKLADMANVELAKPTEKNEVKELKKLNASALRFFQEDLSENEQAQKACLERGIEPKIAKVFGVGSAPDNFGDFKKYIRANHKYVKNLTWFELGLLGKSRKKENSFYTFVRNRLVFPVRDSSGDVLGFTSRTLDDEISPKYLVSSSSEHLPRQDWLYGEYEAKELGLNDEEGYAVEGATDVIAGQRNGLNFVATMGTEASPAACRKLLNKFKALYLVFDGDDAGRKAINSTLSKILPYYGQYSNVKILMLPEGEDPDSYLQRYGRDGFERLKMSSFDALDYIGLDAYAKYKAASTIKEKAKVVKEFRFLAGAIGDADIKRVVSGQLESIVGASMQDDILSKPQIVQAYRYLLDNPEAVQEWNSFFTELGSKFNSENTQKIIQVCESLEKLASKGALTSERVETIYKRKFGFAEMYMAIESKPHSGSNFCIKNALVLEELNCINDRVQLGLASQNEFDRAIGVLQKKSQVNVDGLHVQERPISKQKITV